MPIKFKPSQKTFIKGKGTNIEHFYIKNTPKQELIDFQRINDELACVYLSNSWKITRPIRKLLKKIYA